MTLSRKSALLDAADAVREAAHSCDRECRADSWTGSGHRQTGDRWQCSCGQFYMHVCDEAEGCYWTVLVD